MSDIAVTVTSPGSIDATVGVGGTVSATVSSGGSVAVNLPAGEAAWANITGKPTTFTPSAHTHKAADITDRSTALVTSVNGKTGDVTITEGGGGSSYTLPTATDTVLGGVKIGNGITITDGVISAAGGGGVSLSNAAPSDLGIASAGASGDASRADHVHASPDVSGVLGLSAVLSAKLDAESIVDGGDYVGVVIEPEPATPTITITGQPQNVTMSTAAGSSWTSFGQGSSYWRDAAYAGGTYVAVGTQFNAGANRYYTLTSSDGTNWTFRGTGSSPTVPLQSVATDGTTFLAVSNLSGSGFSTTSTNGIDWTPPVAMPTLGRSVAYGNGRYVSVSGSATYTTDGGVTWSAPVSLSSPCVQVVYGTSGFIALPEGLTGIVYRSMDGVTWTTHSLPVSRNNYKLEFGNGKYVAVSGLVAAYSTDGQTWTETTTTISSLNSVGYAGGVFIATGTNTTANISTDGVTWTAITLPASGPFWATGGSSTIALINRTASAHLFSVGSGSATFSVSATLSPAGTLTYAWETSTDSGSTWSAVSGETSATLSLSGIVSGDSGTQYRAIISATGATPVTSNAATLTVT